MNVTTVQPGQRPSIGEPAPLFSLPSLSGATVDLASYRGRANVVVWFSRGFTCPFCRVYTDGVRAGYEALRAAETEVIQVAPNLLNSARRYFGESILPFPFVCDPDKRLYAVYGLGDLRALEATRTAVVSFAHAFTHGDSVNQIRGAWFDVMNRNFLRRLHHHAMTAQEQGIFLVDKEGVIRHTAVVGPIDPVPDGAQLAGLARAHCARESVPA
jgi:peroxiredoxin